MKINIISAAAAGTTTLGKALSAVTGIPYFDSDDYFWEKSDKPYSEKQNPEKRNEQLVSDLMVHNDWILGGPILNWQLSGLSFDLVVFLWLPEDIRMQRLIKREEERYGELLKTDPFRIANYQSFLSIAAGYDKGNITSSRTFKMQKEWLKVQTCKILEIEGEYSTQEQISKVLGVLNCRVSSCPG